ncbi:MAG: hypothetical protein ACJ71T_08735 [Actinomycetales bacterium]
MKNATLGRLVAGSVALAAVLAAAPSAALATTHSLGAVAASVNGSFTPLTPARVLDTRNGTGAPKAKVASHATLSFDVAGQGGVPATGVSAVVLNVTVVAGSTGGYLTAFPGGTTRPVVSNLNFAAGQTVANLVTVAVGGTGQVSLYNGGGAGVDVIADVSGYYQNGIVSDSGAFVSLAPARVLDTRNGTGAPTAAVGAGQSLTLQVSGAGGVPGSGAGAVVMNVTATSATRTGYITVYPQGAARPTASNLNFTAGRTVPNLVTVGLSGSGKVTLFNGSNGTVNLIADVAGYYLSGTATKGGTFTAIQPTRLLDTRVVGKGTPSSTAVPARMDVGLQITDGVAVPLTNVSAVVTNITATAETRSGYVTAYPTDPTRPTVSNLNHTAAQTIANAAIIQPGLCGKATLYNGSNGSTHLLADVSGYFLTKVAVGPGAKTAKAWGENTLGELGVGTITSTKTPVAMPPFLRDLKSIDGDGLAVSNDGNVWGWGPEELVQLYGQSQPTDVGFGNCSIPVRITDGLSATVTAVAGSPSDAYALDAAGDVWSWGLNDQGQLGNGGTTDNFHPAKVPGLTTSHAAVAIGAGLAALDDGTVFAWGDNSQNQLGDAALGSSFSPTPVQVTGLSGIVSVAQNGDTSYALDGTGNVWAWGSNDNGALGQGTGVTSSSTPAKVIGVGGTGFLNATAISGGAAVLADGSIATWGSDNHGQLGDGAITGHSNTPKAVAPPSGQTFTKVAAGGDVDVALVSDGSVWVWGAAKANGQNADSGTPGEMLPAATGALGVGAGVSAAFVIVP